MTAPLTAESRQVEAVCLPISLCWRNWTSDVDAGAELSGGLSAFGLGETGSYHTTTKL